MMNRRSVPRAPHALLIAVIAMAVGFAASTLAPAQGAPAPIPLPSADPFYRSGPDLSTHRPGDVLRTRPVRFVLEDVATPVIATQIAYRSTGEHDQPIVGVTTVLRGTTAPTTRIVSYHSAYDALGTQCDPSYTMRGYGTSTTAKFEQNLIAAYIASGHTVVVPDYEGTDQQWTIGRQSGRLALDSIRAAERVVRAPSSTPVGMVGYSGGSVPTNFAAELAPTYAPELRIVGAAAGGLPVNLAHNLPYVSGSKDWAGVMPAIVVSYQRAYGIDTASFLSPRGAQIVADVADECIASFADKYPGLTDAEMVRPPYRSILDGPGVAPAIERNVMGNAGRPRIPLMLAVGQSDAIGDGVMITADVADLAARYCASGVTTRFHRYAGDGHGEAFIPFERDAALFLASRFAGQPATGCASDGSAR